MDIGFGGRNRKKRLGDILVDEGLIEDEQVGDILEAQKTDKFMGKKFGEVVVGLGLATEQQIAVALANQLGLELVTLAGQHIPDEIKALCTEEQLRKYNAVPFGFSEKDPNLLKLAMADPLDIRASDDLMMITNYRFEIYVTTSRDVSACIGILYGNEEVRKAAAQFTQEREERNKELGIANMDDVEDNVSDAPIVKLVKQTIESAVRKRASDIHIEPMENTVRVRYRIDGVLQEQIQHPIEIQTAMAARIKIISGLDISEKRKPQDGRATAIVDKVEYDIRVSILPTVYGEKTVMRLTEKDALQRDKSMLGFPDDDLEKFDAIISHPNGIILVTGPTGSGKSTTLYTALSELNVEGVNIITVEDPVEANIPGINQVQTNDKAGLTFASALRSILRQDPDIIMIGEIRDGETADIAVKASITGHLVVSTLHTNSSASTITRLADMGIENYLIADSVVGVIAQRLVRRVCKECCTEREPDDFEKEVLGIAKNYEPVKIKIATTHGDCPVCGGAGYKGRIGVYEIMPVSRNLKKVIAAGEGADKIEAAALAEGMKTLRQAAINYVLQGITTVDEVLRITSDD